VTLRVVNPANEETLAELERIRGDDPAAAQRRLVHIPIGRLAQPREIVNAALFLANEESAYVRGSTFVVDGGVTEA